MELGGIDLELPGKTSIADLEFIIRAIRAAWPEAVYEDSNGQRVVKPLPAPDIQELFAYKDIDSLDSWSASGLTDWNADRMIYVILHADSITFVVDSKGSATGRLAADIIRGLRGHRQMFGFGRVGRSSMPRLYPWHSR